MQWAAVIIHLGFSKVPVQFMLNESLLVFVAIENVTIFDANKVSGSPAFDGDPDTSKSIKIAPWPNSFLIAFNMNTLLWHDVWLIEQHTVKYLTSN